MYQPDAIKYFEVSGTGYIVTANEGGSVEYPTWTEEKRGKSLVDGNVYMDPTSLYNPGTLARPTPDQAKNYITTNG